MVCLVLRARRVSSHHFLVVFVGEVEHRLHDLELVEDFVVSRHVGGQDAPESVRDNVGQASQRQCGRQGEPRAGILLDHSSSDVFVLLTAQVFKDVALWLQTEGAFTTCVYYLAASVF